MDHQNSSYFHPGLPDWSVHMVIYPLYINILLPKKYFQVIEARNSIHSLLETVQEQQEQFTNIASLCDTDAAIPVAFTKDNRVHIGPKMEMRLVVLGLDGAGKTSILFKMKQDEFVSPITTIGKYIPNRRFFIKLRWTSVEDPREGAGGPFHLIFRPNWKKIFL